MRLASSLRVLWKQREAICNTLLPSNISRTRTRTRPNSRGLPFLVPVHRNEPQDRIARGSGAGGRGMPSARYSGMHLFEAGRALIGLTWLTLTGTEAGTNSRAGKRTVIWRSLNGAPRVL